MIKKKQIDKYNTTKNGHSVVGQGINGGNSVSGGIADLKIDNTKNQTFSSDVEDNHSVHGISIGNTL